METGKNWTWEQLVRRGQMLAVSVTADERRGIEHAFDAHVAVTHGINFLRVGGCGFQIVIGGLSFHHKKDDREFDTKNIIGFFTRLVRCTGMPVQEITVSFPEEGRTATVTVTAVRRD